MSLLLGIILVILPVVALASPAEEREETRIPILDTAEEFFGHRVNHLANDFDSFFATERADDELGRSRFRLRESYRIEERAIPRDQLRIGFNLKLPKLEKKFQIDDDDKKKKKNRPETAEEKRRRKEDYLNRNQVNKNWLFNITGNVNASIRPHITLQGRLRKSSETGTLIHRFVQEATWRSNEDGFAQRTSLTSDHSFDQTLLFRLQHNVDWSITKKEFGTSHGPAFLHRISDRSAIAYGAGVGTVVDNGIWYVAGYTVGPTYRRDLYKQILYVDLTTGLSFPKVWSFRRTPFAAIQIEMLFGGN